MYPRAFIVLYALAAATSTIPALSSAIVVGSICTTGTLECCQYVESPLDQPAQTDLQTLGISVTSTAADIGINCTPVATLGGAGSFVCADVLACCTGESYYNGLIVLGCTPVSLVAQ
ncbi:uncharacterized protein BT62DRAFT_932367 [Guyanagaster necrorhizus]|uniref:Hydrophobin n=1 Tax=Guyanagaster necrorhizus TaxID=856835 RepID=A0A9P8AS44_9AGAR|nr:uncharacterized protein BT62DRAFT_932367 [Guyanagaster necrorhizus MCA 3950]KAG7446028.1 hypothetical protein BT62DRAFT_932367 [Guyanagaster necrorhizus MCA 3950]